MFTARKEKGKKISSSILYRLTLRAVLFLFLSVIVFCFFYLTGNYLNYLDSSLSLLISVIGITDTALIIFSLVGIIESIIYIILNKSKRLKYTFFLFSVIII
ncbi:MAG: hypothetical protein K6F15_07415, partial [Treponema sp.]|nr:hypothetical protein [Treponema sp.]